MPRDVQNIAVALGSQHTDLGTVVFKNDIRGNGCAVKQVIDTGRDGACSLAQFVQTL